MNHTFSVEHAVKYGIEEAILIGNFQFWLAKNRAEKRNFFDGRTWTYNTAAAFAELIPYFNAKQVYRLLTSLVDQGVILKGNFNDKASNRTQWFAFVKEDDFLPAIDLHEKRKDAPKKSAVKPAGKGSAPFPENGKCNSHNRELHFQDSGTPFPENGKCLYRTDITTDVNADKNLQTTAAAAPEVPATEPAASESAGPAKPAPAEQPAAAADPKGPSEAFEAAWSSYPARNGNAKHLALTAWQARVREGVSEKALLDGVKDYAAHCKREKVAAKFVMTAGRFFSPEGHYAANWSAGQPSFFDADDGRYPGFTYDESGDNVHPI
jgi:hypothetical protein